MSFRDNLQHLRATHAMTQEQLAMMVGVSRQSVTKWEAERAYPEMDKLLKLCQIFDCTLDELVTGDLTATSPTPRAQAAAAAMRENGGGPPLDVCGYDEHMRAFANRIAAGVGALLVGVSLLILVGTLAECFAPSLEALGLIPMFTGIGICLALILPAFFQHSEFQRSHPYIQDFYTADDRREAQRTFSISLVAGLLLLFVGVDRLLQGGRRKPLRRSRRPCRGHRLRRDDGPPRRGRMAHRARFHPAVPRVRRQLQRGPRASHGRKRHVRRTVAFCETVAEILRSPYD